MQTGVDSRPINRKLATKSSYRLAALWLRQARSLRRWESAKRVAGLFPMLGSATRTVANRRAKQKEAIWDALFVRFDSVYRQALASSGCPEQRLKEETTKCVLRLENLVTSEPTHTCLPELMWRSCDAVRKVPEELRTRLRRRFHLRALLDEMSPSDQRGALRFLVFGERGERAQRKHGGKDLRSSYGSDQRDLVELGLEMFSEDLYKKRHKVSKLTAGAISAAMLTPLDGATYLVIDSLTDDSTGLITDAVADESKEKLK